MIETEFDIAVSISYQSFGHFPETYKGKSQATVVEQIVLNSRNAFRHLG